MNETPFRLSCFLGFHAGEWIVDETAPVQWVGGVVGARPYRPAELHCPQCDARHKKLIRVSGPGMVP